MGKTSKPAGIPKDEIIWETFYENKDDIGYVITSKAGSREWYYLYAREDGVLRRKGKAHSPTEVKNKWYTDKITIGK